MRKISLILILLILVPFQVHADDCQVPAEIQTKIQTAIEEARIVDHIYGITYTAYTSSCFLLTGHSGASNPEGGEISPETTLFRVASISKMFTDLSISQLIDQGILTFETKFIDLTDAPIVQYILDNETPERLRHWKQITIGQMMSHQAGITKDLPGSMVFGNTASLAQNSYPTMADLYKGILDVEFLYPAGHVDTGIKYSNLDINLLARIVEAYNPYGLSFAQYVKQNIGQTLNMKSLYYNVPKSERPRMVQGWGSLLKDKTRTKVPRAYFVGSYDGSIGVATTAKDLAHLGMEFFKLLENQSTLFTDSNVATELFTMKSRVTSTMGWSGGPEWEVLPGQTAKDPLWVGHTGTGSSERAFMMISPELGFGVTIMFNAMDVNREKYAKLISDLLPKSQIQLSPVALERVNGAREFLLNTPIVNDPLPTHKADAKDLQKFVGSYFADINGIRDVTLTNDGYLLYMNHKLDIENLQEGRFRLVPIAGADAINLTREPINFEFDEDGNVSGIHALQTIHYDRILVTKAQ
jgi:CubicO group peptidase (beta-lactamase class C family)